LFYIQKFKKIYCIEYFSTNLINSRKNVEEKVNWRFLKEGKSGVKRQREFSNIILITFIFLFTFVLFELNVKKLKWKR